MQVYSPKTGGGAAPDLSNYVTLDSAQTITGVKEFTGNVFIKPAGASNHPARFDQIVNLTAPQNIGGIKTFSSVARGVPAVGANDFVIKSQLPVVPDLSNIVDRTNNQTVDGIKTFQKVVRGVSAVGDSDLVIRSQVKLKNVDLSGGLVTTIVNDFVDPLETSIVHAWKRTNDLAHFNYHYWRIKFDGNSSQPGGYKKLEFNFEHNVPTWAAFPFFSMDISGVAWDNVQLVFLNIRQVAGLIYVKCEFKVNTTYNTNYSELFIRGIGI